MVRVINRLFFCIETYTNFLANNFQKNAKMDGDALEWKAMENIYRYLTNDKYCILKVFYSDIYIKTSTRYSAIS